MPISNNRLWRLPSTSKPWSWALGWTGVEGLDLGQMEAKGRALVLRLYKILKIFLSRILILGTLPWVIPSIPFIVLILLSFGLVGLSRTGGTETESTRMQKHQHAHLNMYKTMIINTITSREDRATITAIIGVSSEIKRTKHVVNHCR